MLQSSLARKIHELRKAKNLTLDELASETGSSKSYIWELEKGSSRPTVDKISKIATALGVTLEYLLDENQAEVFSRVRDEAFYRKYRAAKPDVKEKIAAIRDILEGG
jgi:transcriptional regulator with XRE-family HTH domain